MRVGISQRASARKHKARPEPEAQRPELRSRNQRIRGMRILGATLAELAGRHGLSITRVHQICSGIQILVARPRPHPKPRTRPERAENFRRLRMAAVDLRKRGFSYREIARRVGASIGAVYAWSSRVRIYSLEGSAWLDLTGRPKAWLETLYAKA